MHPALDFLLTRAPGLYARLIRLRSTPNLEKIVFLSLVRRGDVVMDIGANFGYYTLLFSHLAGAAGRVHAFEPVPPSFAKLADHIAHGRRFDNVVLNEHALAEEERDVTLFVPGTDLGQASIARHSFGSWETQPVVEAHAAHALTVDGYAADRGLQSLSFIKCDVEGAELLVLRGAHETLRRFSPILYLEVCPAWTTSLGYEPADMVRFLAGFGYRQFHLVHDGLSLLGNAERDLAGLQGSANLLCTLPERHASRLARLRRWLPQ